MRALLLPIILALAACTAAAGGQDEEMFTAHAAGDNLMIANAAEEAADALEAASENAADALEAAMGEEVLAGDGNLGNSTEPETRAGPAWLAGGTWLYAGEAYTGAIWYFEGLESDFTVRPHRVLLRTDERADSNSAYDNSERLAEIDCTGHRYRILRTTNYDQAGRATGADERGDGRMVPVPPGSVFAQIEESVCRHAADPGGATYMNGM